MATAVAATQTTTAPPTPLPKAKRLLPVLVKSTVDPDALARLVASKALVSFMAPFAGIEPALDERTQAPLGERIEPSMSYLELMPNVRVSAGQLSGYAAVVRSDLAMDLVNEQAPLFTAQTGTGRTWLRVAEPSAPESELVRAHVAGALKDVESIESTRVILTEGRASGRQRLFYVVVDGGDRVAANTLLRAVRSRGTMTIADAMQLPEYKAALRSSSELRERVARSAAKALGLTVSGDGDAALHDAPTHFVLATNKYSTEARGPHAPGRSYAIVFSDAFNLDTNRHGALVYRGPLAGYTWYRGPEHSDPISHGVSRSWANSTQQRLFSVFPTDTGLYEPTSGREPDEHPALDATMRSLARERIRSFGALPDVNPAFEEAYHSPADAEFQRVAATLGVTKAVSALNLDSILSVVPGLQTKTMTLARAASLVAASSVDSVQVGRSELLRAVGEHWEASPLSKTMTLAQLFANEHADHFVVQRDVLAELASRSPAPLF